MLCFGELMQYLNVVSFIQLFIIYTFNHSFTIFLVYIYIKTKKRITLKRERKRDMERDRVLKMYFNRDTSLTYRDTISQFDLKIHVFKTSFEIYLKYYYIVV